MITRRELMKLGGLALTAGAASRLRGQGTIALTKYVTELRASQLYNLRVANRATPPPGAPQYDFHIKAVAYKQRCHPQLGMTTFWGYADATAPDPPVNGYDPTIEGNPAGGYLGGVVVAYEGRSTRIRFENALPTPHILPVDRSVVGAPQNTSDENRISIHLHGGRVAAKDDGHPLGWFTPGNGPRGPLYLFSGIDEYNRNPIYTYPNHQEARMMWYHDHAVGLTRLNAYAGLASAYLLGDTFDWDSGLNAIAGVTAGNGLLQTKYGIPFLGIPLVLQDKSFDGPINGVSNLYYPSVYPDAPLAGAPEPIPGVSLVPEMFGDVNVVNGMVWPKLKVRPGMYRFRMLNGAQSKFYRLKLFVAKSDGTPDFTKPGPQFLQIGTEGGFLPAVAIMNQPTNPAAKRLLIGPGERADVLIDFSAYASGTKFILQTDAAGPFPSGDPVTPNTSVVMMFEVETNAPSAPIPPFAGGLSAMLNALNADLNSYWLENGGNSLVTTGVEPTILTLNEAYDLHGRLIQIVGGNTRANAPEFLENVFGTPFLSPDGQTVVTKDVIRPGQTYVWDICNLTADTHPMHIHLVNFKIIHRRGFNAQAFLTAGRATANPVSPSYLGLPIAPEPNERGWKETARMNPGQVTRVAFRIPAEDAAWAGTSANNVGEYVWHCHILEHEEHDMMHGLKLQNP